MWPAALEAPTPVLHRSVGQVVSLGPQAAHSLQETEDTAT